ncbi:MAG: TIGR03960 family B12-binding radical SAM protein [Candidatus Thorarchaeota archaeon]
MLSQSLQDILPLIRCPSHYLGTEINALRKDPQKVRLRFALAFPDLYEVGMSHVGIQVLYHILNARQSIAAERVFAPRLDLEARLRAGGIPLCSLESGTPVSRFDIVGFSLLYELNFSNVIGMLNLSGLPLYARDRDETHPFVIAGGPCAFNPEPMADFFDVMVVGDGETVVLELADAWLAWKDSGAGREALLKTWSNLQGVYVPSFFQASAVSKGLQIVTPRFPEYGTVNKALVTDLNQISLPTRPVVPFGKPIHDRLSLELCRGCTRGCRFCQAGMIYRPVRERAPGKILSWARQALASTGYEEVSLLSLSTGDYSAIHVLVERLMNRLAPERIAVSLPSLRVGSLTTELMEQIKRVRKTGFTVAPEAGSDRLRRVINKNVSEQSLEETVEYVRGRVAFGSALAGHQAVSFALAEADTWLELARWQCYRVLWLREQGAPCQREGAMAKWWSPKMAAEVIHKCLLLHGHMGYRTELPHQQRLRDVIGWQIGDGSEEVMKLIITRELFGSGSGKASRQGASSATG